MKIFEKTMRGTKYQFVCDSERTRTGFRHTCVCLSDGYETVRAKVTYQNRTWESYVFQTVLHKTIDAMKLSIDIDRLVKEQLKIWFDKQYGGGYR